MKLYVAFLLAVWAWGALCCTASAANKTRPEDAYPTPQAAVEHLKEIGILSGGDNYHVNRRAEALQRSKELMAHFENYRAGKEPLKNYDYVDAIVFLGKYGMKPGETFPVGVLEPFLKAGCKAKKIPPMVLACYRPRAAAELKALLKAGRNPNTADEQGETALHAALRSGLDAKVVQALIKAKANVNAKGDFSYTPLHIAVRSGAAPEVVRVLLAAGADQKAKTSTLSGHSNFGITPIMMLCDVIRDADKVDSYLAAGMKDNMQEAFTNVCQWRPLLIPVFIKHGGKVNQPEGKYGNTPALNACAGASEEEFMAVVKAGADFSKKNLQNYNGLHYLGKNKNATLKMLQAVLDSKPDLNAQEKVNKWTPLHIFANNKAMSVEVVEALLRAGADPRARDANGKTPADLAAACGNEPVANLLREKK